MPKYLVSRTLLFATTQVIEVEADDENEAIIEAEGWNRGDEPPAGLQMTSIEVDEIQDEEGVVVHQLCPVVALPI